MNFWCKLFNMILNVWERVVEGVGFALKTVGTVLVDTVGGIVGEVGNAIGSLLGIDGSTFLWLLIGGGALYLLSKDDTKDDPRQITVTQTEPISDPNQSPY